MIDLQIPENVYAVTTEQALTLLGISRSTLGDFKQCLNYERPQGWDYQPNQRGFTRQQLRILLILKQLVKVLGRPSAQAQLHKAIKEQLQNV